MANARFSAVLVATVAVMAVASVVFAYGLLFGNQVVNNQGNVDGIRVGVYAEAACINNVRTIDWGFMEPGASKAYTVYVRNEGNLAMKLNMTVDPQSWIPGEASAYMDLSWNVEGTVVNPASVARADLTLFVSPTIAGITSFSFNITITGLE